MYSHFKLTKLFGVGVQRALADMPLSQATAGNVKKQYLTGKTQRGHPIGEKQLSKLHDQLFEYANMMESKGQEAKAQTLKACLAQRKAELEVKKTTEKAGLAREGCEASHEEALAIAELCQALAKKKATHTHEHY